MEEQALRTRALSKDYDDVRAVSDVGLVVPCGSVCGLVGPNGAGKSTLMGLLSGALRPTAGEALVMGEPVFDNPSAKARVAWIPSDPFFFASEDLDGMASYYALAFPSFDAGRFEELAGSFELDRTRKLRKLSKGMRRQAAFWLTLSLRSDVLLLDEPMDGLDPLVRRRMWQLVLGEVAGRGLTVLVSTHNLRELEGVCDRLAIMEQGRLTHQLDLAGGDTRLVKAQVILPEGASLPAGLTVEHESDEGRMRTLVVRGTTEEVRAALSAARPLYLQLVPLSLEELFLYEVGGCAR